MKVYFRKCLFSFTPLGFNLPAAKCHLLKKKKEKKTLLPSYWVIDLSGTLALIKN